MQGECEALARLKDEDRDDKTIVLAAVKNVKNKGSMASPLSCASARLQDDKDLVLEAVRLRSES